MISRTSRATAQRVRRKLDVAPREIKNERMTLSVEQGRYLLANKLVEDAAWWILAPSDRPDLLNELVIADEEGGWRETLHSTGVEHRLREIGADLKRADFIVYNAKADQEGDFGLGVVGRHTCRTRERAEMLGTIAAEGGADALQHRGQ